MIAAIRPEPSAAEREAILAALEGAPKASAWGDAALLEGVDAAEPDEP